MFIYEPIIKAILVFFAFIDTILLVDFLFGVLSLLLSQPSGSDPEGFMALYVLEFGTLIGIVPSIFITYRLSKFIFYKENSRSPEFKDPAETISNT